MEDQITLKFHCLFCFSKDFVLPDKNYSPQSGHQILCANCGRSNDYDSLMRVAKKNAKEWAEEQVTQEINRFTKELSRLFK
jgi:hypothetical protein